MADSYDQLLVDLARDVGLNPAALSQTEELVVGDYTIGLACEGDAGAENVMFFTTLGRVDESNADTVIRTLMRANYLWAGTNGATLGMHPETRDVALCGQLPLAILSGTGFAALLAGPFIETAGFWRSFLEGAVEQALPTDGVGSEGRVGFLPAFS